GPGTATNVSVTDLFPQGLLLLAATPSQGYYLSSVGLWALGTVNPGVTATLTLTALFLVPYAQTNFAFVSHADQPDPDPSNNDGSAPAQPLPALAVATTVDNPTPSVGDPVTPTLRPTNKGPSAATNVSVTDLFPAGLALVSATPSQGRYESSVGL